MLLATLPIPIICLSSEMTVILVNDAFASLTGVLGDRGVGSSFEGAFPELARGAGAQVIRSTQRDGTTRTFRWQAESVALPVEVQVSRAENGSMALTLRIETQSVNGVSSGDAISELAALRRLAHEMAVAPDTTRLLRTLCEVATETCAGAGAAVTQIQGDHAVVVAGAGSGTLDVGGRYPLAGSLTGRAIAEGTLIGVEDYASRGAAMNLSTENGPIGEILLVPLTAADATIGVLLTWRARGGRPFTAVERDRLVTLANHASILLHKVQLHEAAESASLAKSNFLATISHELRTPVAALTGYGELLADDIVGPLMPEARDIVERMRSVTRHLGSMIDDLLVYSSLERGGEIVHWNDVRCDEVVREVEALIAPLAEKKGLDLQVDIPDRTLRLHTDPDKLRQILVNVGGNAVKFTESGSVRIAVTTLEDGTTEIAVQDTGIGIAAEDRDRLFQPFMQLDSGLTRRHGGTGLGLHNSARLATLIGVTIGLTSEPGVGSRFAVTVPAKRNGASEAGEATGSAEQN